MRSMLWLVPLLLVAGCVAVGSDEAEVSVEERDPAEDARSAGERSPYGPHPDQHVVVHRPETDQDDLPAVVLIHGGFWMERYRADLMTPLAEDLAAAGHTVVNVEYRRVGGAGGWPATFEDVAAALDHLADLPEVADGRVVTVGHSAGGHLAVWAAARHRLPEGATGAGPKVRPCAAISQAGMVDLAASAEAGLGGRAVSDLMGGGPAVVPDRYAVADPAALLPLAVPVVLVHGQEDDIVPPRISRSYAERAHGRGDDVEVVILPGGHFDAIDPKHPLWRAVVDRIEAVCP